MRNIDEEREIVAEQYAMGFRIEVIAERLRISQDETHEHFRIDKHLKLRAKQIRKEKQERKSKLVRCSGTNSRTGAQWC